MTTTAATERLIIRGGTPLHGRVAVSGSKNAALYAVAHLLIYVLDQKWNLAVVAIEILRRFYLTIGFAALVYGSFRWKAGTRELRRHLDALAAGDADLLTKPLDQLLVEIPFDDTTPPFSRLASP